MRGVPGEVLKSRCQREKARARPRCPLGRRTKLQLGPGRRGPERGLGGREEGRRRTGPRGLGGGGRGRPATRSLGQARERGSRRRCAARVVTGVTTILGARGRGSRAAWGGGGCSGPCCLIGPEPAARPGRGLRPGRGAGGAGRGAGARPRARDAAPPPAQNGDAAAREPTAQFYSLSRRNKKVAIY